MRRANCQKKGSGATVTLLQISAFAHRCHHLQRGSLFMAEESAKEGMMSRIKFPIFILILASIALAQNWVYGPVHPVGRHRWDAEYFPTTNKVYFFPGRISTTYYNEIYSYDPVTQAYSGVLNSLPIAIANYDICLLRDDYDLPAGDTYGLYCIAGSISGGYTNAVQVYYPVTNQTRIITTDPYGLAYGAVTAVVCDNKIYAFGGFAGGPPTNQGWVYDPSAPPGTRWTPLPNLPLARCYMMGAVVDSFVYALGGDTSDGVSLYPRSECWRLNTRNLGEGWQAITPLPYPTDQSRAFGFSSRSPYGFEKCIIVAGRGYWPSESNESFIYNTQTNVWTTFPNLIQARRNHAGAFIPGTQNSNGIPGIWVWGGRQGSDLTCLTQSEYYQLRYTVRDVGVTKIIEPTGMKELNTLVIPACSVYNFGNTTESYTVRMKIGIHYDSTVSVSGHAPGEYLYCLLYTSDAADE